MTDFVPDWQLWKSRDYLLDYQRDKSAFNPYKKRSMEDVKKKKLDLMFTFYKKTVTNLLYDNVFEDNCYDLDFNANLYYADNIFVYGDSWIGSRQYEYYPDPSSESTSGDQHLDVYF